MILSVLLNPFYEFGVWWNIKMKRRFHVKTTGKVISCTLDPSRVTLCDRATPKYWHVFHWGNKSVFHLGMIKNCDLMKFDHHRGSCNNHQVLPLPWFFPAALFVAWGGFQPVLSCTQPALSLGVKLMEITSTSLNHKFERPIGQRTLSVWTS